MSNKSHKLNQVIAVEKGTKARVQSEVTELYKIAQKPALFEGLARTYEKAAEDQETFPAESTRVQAKANDVLRQAGNRLTELFNVTATKDYANCLAKADVMIDGQVVIKDAPATFLLFLEKQLTDLHTLVSNLPVLDPSQEWVYDQNSELFKTGSVRTAKTKKVQKALVLLQPTDKHPGQAVQITEDAIVGHWNQVRMSGALPAPSKTAMLAKVEKLQRAVKYAREEANLAEAATQDVGEKLFTWLLSQ